MRWLVTGSTVCAVRYEREVFFGSVVRYGFKSKSGLISDLRRPVSLKPGDRAKGLVFMFAWLEAHGSPNKFVYTGEATLEEGSFNV